MKKDATAIKYRITLNIDDIEKIIYMSDNEFNSLDICPLHGGPNYDMIAWKYFDKEKIEQLKKDICKKIMETETPFDIYEVDLDSYPVEESEIWKMH